MSIPVSPTLVISEQDVTFEYARSPGPGGQHVNKAETQVTLCFDVDGARSLSEQDKRLLKRRLRSRLTKDGILRVRARKYRSQRMNREWALRRFVQLLRDAFRPRRRRIPTRVPSRSRRERLHEKRVRGEKKRLRRRPPPEQE